MCHIGIGILRAKVYLILLKMYTVFLYLHKVHLLVNLKLKFKNLGVKYINTTHVLHVFLFKFYYRTFYLCVCSRS